MRTEIFVTAFAVSYLCATGWAKSIAKETVKRNPSDYLYSRILGSAKTTGNNKNGNAFDVWKIYEVLDVGYFLENIPAFVRINSLPRYWTSNKEGWFSVDLANCKEDSVFQSKDGGWTTDWTCNRNENFELRKECTPEDLEKCTANATIAGEDFVNEVVTHEGWQIIATKLKVYAIKGKGDTNVLASGRLTSPVFMAKLYEKYRILLDMKENASGIWKQMGRIHIDTNNINDKPYAVDGLSLKKKIRFVDEPTVREIQKNPHFLVTMTTEGLQYVPAPQQSLVHTLAKAIGEHSLWFIFAFVLALLLLFVAIFYRRIVHLLKNAKTRRQVGSETKKVLEQNPLMSKLEKGDIPKNNLKSDDKAIITNNKTVTFTKANNNNNSMNLSLSKNLVVPPISHKEYDEPMESPTEKNTAWNTKGKLFATPEPPQSKKRMEADSESEEEVETLTDGKDYQVTSMLSFFSQVFTNGASANDTECMENMHLTAAQWNSICEELIMICLEMNIEPFHCGKFESLLHADPSRHTIAVDEEEKTLKDFYQEQFGHILKYPHLPLVRVVPIVPIPLPMELLNISDHSGLVANALKNATLRFQQLPSDST